ncbi:hypothetical protein DM01DRAFT_1338655 [Hesseltinella vesiculosa]|uniref:Zn(2)-C6 fungal-type domain-containing protein n=1 Tax=Hesseltinella vesiculosa TaxID=101127 RepID=A0A1X2G9N3_9FUNG|nr:hypothetical protein DM01DRAFT_1338655 [Hesseltinella vesiculosa]
MSVLILPGKRSKPCQNCKLLRRKCERNSTGESCKRCLASNKPCISEIPPIDKELEAIDGSVEMEYLLKQVHDLEHSMANFQAAMHHPPASQTQNQTDMDMDSMTDSPFLSPSASTSSFATPQSFSEEVLIRFPTSATSSPIMSSPQPPDALAAWVSKSNTGTSLRLFGCANGDRKDSTTDDDSQPHAWNLTLANGRLSLDSPIRSDEDLQAYSSAFHRFLSPFSALFENTAFVYERITHASLLPRTIDMVSYGQRRKRAIRDRPLIDPANPRPNPLLAAILRGEHGPIELIDRLVSAYMTCVNPAMPFLHEPTYLAAYRSRIRNNPYADLLTMTLCCSVGSSSCIHVNFTTYERRILADHFYSHAMRLLTDTFDEPEHRLETLMAINFINEYHRMTMRVNEAQKWIAVASMIAADLAKDFGTLPRYLSKPDHLPSAPPKAAGYGPPALTDDPLRAMFLRHHFLAICHQKYLNLVLHRNADVWELLNLFPLEITKDESETTYDFLSLMNHMLFYMANPIILDLTERLTHIMLGEETKVSLDLILRFDQVFDEWWSALPAEDRLCPGDPSKPESRQYLAACKSQKQLMLYCLSLAQKQEVYLSLARPRLGTRVSFDGASELTRAIQSRYVSCSFDCLMNILESLKYLEESKLYCVFSCDIILGVVDQLSTLCNVEDKVVAERARKQLKQTIRELECAWFMHGNIVVREHSPLFKMEQDKSLDYTHTMDMYDHYPNPALAFSYDVLRTSQDLYELTP